MNGDDQYPETPFICSALWGSALASSTNLRSVYTGRSQSEVSLETHYVNRSEMLLGAKTCVLCHAVN